MTATYATYQGNPGLPGYNASRVVRYMRHGAYNKLAIFDPPSSFTGARPVYIYWPGGANQKKNDFSLGASAIAQYMTDVFGAYVVLANGRQGGIDKETAEETDMIFSPDLQAECALAVMFLRANATNTAVVGSTRTIQIDPRYWCAVGDSAGAWRFLWSQLIPRGDFGDLADALAATGDADFKYHHDHTVGHFWAFEGQSALHQFGEYVTSAAGDGTYTVNGAHAVGVSSVALTGGGTDVLYRHNRLTLAGSTSYTVTTNTANGAATIPVTGDTKPIPQGCAVRYQVGATWYTNIVSADYAGGAGSIAIAGSVVALDPETQIPAGTAMQFAQEVAVVADMTPSAGAGTVSIWPPIEVAIPSGATVVIQHMTGESYSDQSWAIGYLGTKSDGRTWRTIPIGEKYQASLNYLIRADNPRVRELNLLINSPSSECLQRVDSLTHARSFWTRRNQTMPAPLPEHISLHDESDMAAVAHAFYLAAGNTSNVQAYLGDRRSNPSGTNTTDLPWLKGRNSAFTAATTVPAFLTDSTRAGGAFA